MALAFVLWKRCLMRHYRLGLALFLIGMCLVMSLLFYDALKDADQLPEEQQSVFQHKLHSDPSEYHKEPIESYEANIKELEHQVANLQLQLKEAAQKASDARELDSNDQIKTGKEDELLKQYRSAAIYLQNHFDQTIRESEITSGVSLNNEYELFPFCRFTLTRLYLVDPGLGKRVVEKPIGKKKKEILEVVNAALNKLNEQTKDGLVYTMDDFLEGIYRTEPTLGTHYELYFRARQPVQVSALRYHRIVLTRPYGPVHYVAKESIQTQRSIINIILPLKGRLDKFATFMERFAKVCIQHDKRVKLNVVYFGDEGLQNITQTIERYKQQYNFNHIDLIQLRGNFSRGRGLQVGAQSLDRSSPHLLFFCDVDVVFSTDFLERCRLNAQEGKRVYYPMVFSLYNPNVVYSLQDMPLPSENEQLAISKDTGFWRDFGYGMTCQYLTDFDKIGGFAEDVIGWGSEDVFLYKKYLQSNYLVIRATDPGIFHQWHEKLCDPNLSQDQYRGCIRSKALNEASHAQLGMLAFKEEIDIHRSIKTKKLVYNNPGQPH